jgi:signal transduction histidine kinase
VEYGQRVSRIEHFARTYGVDVLVVLLVIAAMLEVAVRPDSTNAPRTTLWFCVPALALMVLPLFARRRVSFAAPAAFWLLAAALSFVDGRLIPFSIAVFLIGMAASFMLGNLHESRQAWTGLVIALAGAGVVTHNEPTHTASSLVFIPSLFGISWLAGFALRSREEQAEAAEARAAQAERERDAAMRVAVAEERARIARELHDIVAHAVSVMVLQVGAVRHKLPDALAEDRDALRGVEQAGRTALTEMRRLLGAMRNDGDDVELGPQPGLDELDALLDQVARAGLPVDLHVDGERVPLPRTIDLSAYRIIQEGLTNTLKHARATRADVTLRYAPDALQIEVRDDGRGTGVGSPGYGLVGVRERVKIYGGEMSAATENGGGFVLRTRLPLEGGRG